jgi:hypothetical protein
MRTSVTFSESGGTAPTQEELATQGRKGTPTQQPPAVPRGGEMPTQEREVLPFNNLPLLLEPVALTRFF